MDANPTIRRRWVVLGLVLGLVLGIVLCSTFFILGWSVVGLKAGWSLARTDRQAPAAAGQ